MKNFLPSQFFDLSVFPYADIFSAEAPVWEALPNIETYIQQLFATGKVKPNYKDRTDVYIGEGTKVHEHVEIVGPAIIGSDCVLGHASLIRGGVILGNGVHIGHGVEIKHSVMLNNAVAAHLNYIGDSIIGNNVNISGGAITANFRLDKKNITVQSDEERIPTQLNKLGVIMGDNSIIGVNAVTNPGTILGKDVVIYPLVSVKGTHENGAILK